MDGKNLIGAGLELISKAGKAISENDSIKETIFGTYTNGKPRSAIDALNGEIFHPEDKLAIARRIERNNKKKKKKNKKGKKYAKIDLDS